MEIVIKLDDELYNEILSRKYSKTRIEKAVAKGIPLPEHGDLIDRNDIWNNIPDVNVLTNHFTTYDIQHFVDDAPTIIEGSEIE